MSEQLSLLSPTLDDATARRLGLQHTREVKRPRMPLVDVPRAAKADPSTSHLAAERIAKSGALGEQQQIVLDAVGRFPGSTSAELAERIAQGRGEDYGDWRQRVARRLPELAVFHVKRDRQRICKVNLTLAITWWPA